MSRIHDSRKVSSLNEQLRIILEKMSQMQMELNRLRAEEANEKRKEASSELQKVDVQYRIMEFEEIIRDKKIRNEDLKKRFNELKKKNEQCKAMAYDQRECKKKAEDAIEQLKQDIEQLKTDIQDVMSESAKQEREHLEAVNYRSAKVSEFMKRHEELVQEQMTLTKNREEKRLEKEQAQQQLDELMLQLKELCPDLPTMNIERMIAIFKEIADNLRAQVGQTALKHEIMYENETVLTNLIAGMEEELEEQRDMATELSEQYNEIFACVNEPMIMPTTSENDRAVEGSADLPLRMMEDEETGEIEEYTPAKLDEIVGHALNLLRLEKRKPVDRKPLFPTCKRSDVLKIPLEPPENPVEILPWTDYIEANELVKQEYYEYHKAYYIRKMGEQQGLEYWETQGLNELKKLRLFEDESEQTENESDQSKELTVVDKTTVDDERYFCAVCREIWTKGFTMLQCDTCLLWYHLVCGKIFDQPKEEEPWYCQSCLEKN